MDKKILIGTLAKRYPIPCLLAASRLTRRQLLPIDTSLTGGSRTVLFAVMISVDAWQECRHTRLLELAFPRSSHARTRARTSEGVNGFSR